MVLADTSVWVNFFNGVLSERTDFLSLLIEKNQVCLCPVIIQEILQGISSDREFDILRSDLLAFQILNFDIIEASFGAANIYRTGRKKGFTIRKSNDCLIAWYALKANVRLLAEDRDFAQIASFTDLQLAD